MFDLNPDATFWNGKPVTPQDVVFSLERNRNSKLGGFYGPSFARVTGIKASGPKQVTITLSKTDYWLLGELSQMPGKRRRERLRDEEGASFGTPAGGTMCTGAYKLGSWKPGEGCR